MPVRHVVSGAPLLWYSGESRHSQSNASSLTAAFVLALALPACLENYGLLNLLCADMSYGMPLENKVDPLAHWNHLMGAVTLEAYHNSKPFYLKVLPLDLKITDIFTQHFDIPYQRNRSMLRTTDVETRVLSDKQTGQPRFILKALCPATRVQAKAEDCGPSIIRINYESLSYVNDYVVPMECDSQYIMKPSLLMLASKDGTPEGVFFYMLTEYEGIGDANALEFNKEIIAAVLSRHGLMNPDLKTTRSGLSVSKIKEVLVSRVIYDMAMGIKDLKDKGFIHGDIKPANGLVTKSYDNVLQCKLIDFELASRIGSDVRPRGTFKYLAPDAILRRADPSMDMWSLGVTLFRKVTGFYPFPVKSRSHWYSIVSSDNHFAESFTMSPETRQVLEIEASPELVNLVHELLKPHSSRITVEDVLGHPWLSICSKLLREHKDVFRTLGATIEEWECRVRVAKCADVKKANDEKKANELPVRRTDMVEKNLSKDASATQKKNGNKNFCRRRIDKCFSRCCS